MSIMYNESKPTPTITTTSAGYKIDCAKECPCGVPVIPVPDQWLEVMVTGGFKVWHIIFIIIAFVITLVVVYCCFHRCRIPRTKQEIEADLMRSNLTTKFRDYLQEFPNEPTTFLEALKRVQELEEKSEQDDSGAKKRMGWLKLRGKDRQVDKAASAATGEDSTAKIESGLGPVLDPSTTALSELPQTRDNQITAIGESGDFLLDANLITNNGDKHESDFSKKPIKTPSVQSTSTKANGKLKLNVGEADTEARATLHPNSSPEQKALSKKRLFHLKSSKQKNVHDKPAANKSAKEEGLALESSVVAGDRTQQQHTSKSEDKSKRSAKSESKVASKVKENLDIGGLSAPLVASPERDSKADSAQQSSGDRTSSQHGASGLNSTTNRSASKSRRKRDKPNLSRTKATHVRSRGESLETNNNILTIPTANHHHHHHHNHGHNQHQHNHTHTQHPDKDRSAHSHTQDRQQGSKKRDSQQDPPNKPMAAHSKSSAKKEPHKTASSHREDATDAEHAIKPSHSKRTRVAKTKESTLSTVIQIDRDPSPRDK